MHGVHTFAVKLFQNHPDIQEGGLEVVQLFSLVGVCQGWEGGGGCFPLKDNHTSPVVLLGCVFISF